MATSARYALRTTVLSTMAVLLIGSFVGGPAATAQSTTAPDAEILSLSGMTTNVDLDAGTLAVLEANNVSVTPVTPATVSTSSADGTTTASFPITEGYVAVYPESVPPFIKGTFSHSGGLTFTAGGTAVTATDFIVNPGSSTLTATVGDSAVQLLDLDGSNVQVTQDGAVTRVEGTVAELSATGAQALNQAFGVTLFSQGIPLGTVRIAAQGTAGPGGAPATELLSLGGNETNVDLDAGTLAVLEENNVSVSPVGAASVSSSGGTTTASFPISQGYVSVYPESEQPFIRGTFSHIGGLTFSAGGASVTATDFIVNPGSSTLTATVGGNAVQLLDLDGSNVEVTQVGAVTRIEGTVAELSSDAAAALNQTFGVTLFEQGIPLGVVRIAAVEGPPPGIVGSTQGSESTTSTTQPSTSNTTQGSTGSSQTPSGGVATGGGGTAGNTSSTNSLALTSVALLAVLAAGAGAWHVRTSRTSQDGS